MAPSRLLRRLTILGLIGLLGAPALVALAALSGLGHRWVDILAQFTAPALIGAVLIGLMALILRLWPAAIAGALVSILTLVAVWPQWAPTRSVAEPGAPVVTLYFANLYMGNDDVAAIARSVREADPDVVVLVEMSDRATARIEDILAAYPYRAIERRPSGRLGDRITIASRRPLSARPQVAGEAPYVAATVQTALGPLDVIGVHLTRPWPYQYQWAQIRQAMHLTEVRKGMDHPVVMAGDFNSVSSARIGRQIKADMGLIPAPGWPGTWPSQAPSPLGITIDQVYRSPDLALLDRRLGRPTGSDHRPVIVRLAQGKTTP
ncbi:MAG: endonuclease/exonuclease/phosphatase family protein [Brevundimonas sp.]|uniref:endonuclease/exonuclease/phosphatase family protein n=1 Tax=Brevundimonas sp. TaxID=1871086 RepID=UPI004033D23C